jgi:hypothetical protein
VSAQRTAVIEKSIICVSHSFIHSRRASPTSHFVVVAKSVNFWRQPDGYDNNKNFWKKMFNPPKSIHMYKKMCDTEKLWHTRERERERERDESERKESLKATNFSALILRIVLKVKQFS